MMFLLLFPCCLNAPNGNADNRNDDVVLVVLISFFLKIHSVSVRPTADFNRRVLTWVVTGLWDLSKVNSVRRTKKVLSVYTHP